jgi:hypothetical protein
MYQTDEHGYLLAGETAWDPFSGERDALLIRVDTTGAGCPTCDGALFGEAYAVAALALPTGIEGTPTYTVGPAEYATSGISSIDLCATTAASAAIDHPGPHICPQPADAFATIEPGPGVSRIELFDARGTWVFGSGPFTGSALVIPTAGLLPACTS